MNDAGTVFAQTDLEEDALGGRNPDNTNRARALRAQREAEEAAERRVAEAQAEQKRTAQIEVGGVAADRLRSIVERIERLEEEKKALQGDIKDIYLEAKSAGFDPVVLRRLLKLRQMEPADVEEQETLLALYKRALGM